MGIGLVSLQTSQKRELSGPPFVSTAADNGLSVDGVSGRIVLGNDVGDPAAPAALLSIREIDMGAFGIILNAIAAGIQTLLTGQLIDVVSANGSAPQVSVEDTLSGNPQMNVTVSGGLGGFASFNAFADPNDTARFHLASGNDEFIISTNGAGAIDFFGPFGIEVMTLNTGTFQWQVGPGTGNFNGADFQVNGTCTYRRLLSSKGAGAYNVDRDTDTGKLFTNSAANTFNLPNMAGANNRSGFIFRLTINNAGGSTIQLFAGQVIRFGSLTTSAGGTLSSTDVGATVVLVWTSSVWITESFNGAWLLT